LTKDIAIKEKIANISNKIISVIKKVIKIDSLNVYVGSSIDITFSINISVKLLNDNDLIDR